LTSTPRAPERITEGFARAFSRAWEEQGVAEEIAGRWRLTRSGRAMFSAWVHAPLAHDEDEAA
jgi:hypothetical protein